MPNWKGPQELKNKKEEYDYVDEQGKGWRLKKGETLAELRKRAKR